LHLQADKETLKEAVRAAIAKRDELFDRAVRLDKALTEEREKVALLETRVTKLSTEN
jgi:hypothetical protein